MLRFGDLKDTYTNVITYKKQEIINTIRGRSINYEVE